MVKCFLCYCWVSCAVVFSLEHAQRWPFANRDHEGHRVQTSVHYSLLGFRAFLSLYCSFSSVLPRSTCVLFLRNCEFSHSTSCNGFTVFVKCSRVTAYWRTSGINVEISSCKVVYGLRFVSIRIYNIEKRDWKGWVLYKGRWLCNPSHQFLIIFQLFPQVMSLMNGEAGAVFMIMVLV